MHRVSSGSVNGDKPGESAGKVRSIPCPAGHHWEWTVKQGMPPSWCPDHDSYREYPISTANLPPERVKDEWDHAERLYGGKGYAKRWQKEWEFTVRRLAARAGSWAHLPLDEVEEYIRHRRLAELHRIFAERDPYPHTESGSVRAHPGWEKAQREEVQARKAARALGLIEDAARSSSRPTGDPTQLQQEAAESGLSDDQVGPDGRPL